MPYTRPSLSELRDQVAADITTYLPVGAAPLLRFNNLGIIGKVQARLVNGLYGRLNYIALQGTPWTVTDASVAAAWGALRGVFQKPAVAATGTLPLTGTEGATILAGSTLKRGDGALFTTTADALVTQGVATCPVIAAAAGSAGNTAPGVTFALVSGIEGVNSAVTLATALTGGLDQETFASFKARYLARYAAPPQGGSRDDYPAWALAVAGVTRAWVRVGSLGSGSLTVFVMLDVENAAVGGFPVGTNGVAAGEHRSAAATGDQLTVANAIFPQQPADALVYLCSPIPEPLDVTIQGLPANLQAKVAPALQAMLSDEATPGGVYMADGSTAGLLSQNHIWTAVYAATGYSGFRVVAPSADVQTGTGQLTTLGQLTFT